MLVESGIFSSGKRLPYITIEKIGATLDRFDTCANRYEEHLFNIHVFAQSNSKASDLATKVENKLDWQRFTVQNRIIENIEFVEKMEQELIPAVHKHSLQYLIQTQKKYTEGLYSITLDGRIGERINRLMYTNTTTKYHSVKRPYLFVPKYTANDFFRTTKSRLETIDFEICVQGYNPFDIETILEEVDNTLSYCRLEVPSNRRFTTLQWVGNSLMELRPELWHGTVKYNLVLEKDI